MEQEGAGKDSSSVVPCDRKGLWTAGRGSFEGQITWGGGRRRNRKGRGGTLGAARLLPVPWARPCLGWGGGGAGRTILGSGVMEGSFSFLFFFNTF